MGETVQSETRTGAASQPSGGEGQNTVSTEQEQPNATVSLSPWACAAPWAALGILLAVAAGLLIGERRQDWDYTENLWLIALVGGTMNGTRTWIVVWSILAQRPRWERVFYVLVGLGVLAAIRAFFPRYVSNSAANVAINAAMQLTCLALPLIYLRRRGRQVRLPGPGECRARNAHSSLFRFSIGELRWERPPSRCSWAWP